MSGLVAAPCRPSLNAKVAVVLALLLGIALSLLGGCATRSNATPVRVGDDIAFIDLDSFDSELAADLRRQREAVTVRFPNQPASVNALPSRLQKWLSAVHRHGGGITVQTADGYASKSALGLVSALVAGYRLLRDNMPNLLGRDYRAVITLSGPGGDIERVEFVQIATTAER